MGNVYAFPSFGFGESLGLRVGGGWGLGNMLFPVARCVVFARRLGLKVISPTWTSIRLGPILRNEKDKRFYSGLFKDELGISGLRKALILNAAQFLPESEEAVREALRKNEARPRVVVFKGMEGWFSAFLEEHEFVRSELLRIVRPEQLARLEGFTGEGIGVHVRLGDFLQAPEPGSGPLLANRRTPMSWYVETIAKVRRFLGRDVKVFLFSDGRDEELSELLALPEVRRVHFGSAISDILALSRCRLLMVSGGSSFGMWAGYLGRGPGVWYPSHHAKKIYPDEGLFWDGLGAGEELPALLKANLEKSFLARTT